MALAPRPLLWSENLNDLQDKDLARTAIGAAAAAALEAFQEDYQDYVAQTDAALDARYTKVEINDLLAGLDLSPYALSEDLTALSASVDTRFADLATTYLSQAAFDSAVDSISASLEDRYTKTEINSLLTALNLGQYALQSSLDSFTNAVDAALSDRYTIAAVDGLLQSYSLANHQHDFSELNNRPTTLSGYGITDAQATLVSGTNLKTINTQSLLGAGNISIVPGGVTTQLQFNDDGVFGGSGLYFEKTNNRTSLNTPTFDAAFTVEASTYTWVNSKDIFSVKNVGGAKAFWINASGSTWGNYYTTAYNTSGYNLWDGVGGFLATYNPTYPGGARWSAQLWSYDDVEIIPSLSSTRSLVIGKAFAASPVAGRLAATSGLGTNIAGASLQLNAGQGSGTAVGGDILLQIAKAGAVSGAAVNALSTQLRVSASDGAVRVPCDFPSGVQWGGLRVERTGFETTDYLNLVTQGGYSEVIGARHLNIRTATAAGASLWLLNTGTGELRTNKRL